MAEPDIPSPVVLETCRVDLVSQVATWPDGRTARLTAKEAAMLSFLAARAGQTVDRETLLREVWGFRGRVPDSRAPDFTMLRLRQKLEADPSAPKHLLTVHGEGYRFVRSQKRAPASIPPPPALSLPANPFVGRERDLALLGGLVAHGWRLLTLTGPGGVGKTRLATEFALRHDPTSAAGAQAFPGGVVFVEAESATDGAALEALLLRALGGEGSWALRRRARALLVVDNLEQVVGPAADLLGRWSREAPQAVVLVTSRERLALPEEQVLPVEPLSVEGPPEASAAVELFLARARQVRPTWEPEPAELRRVGRLVARLDGLPLALELAAARLRSSTVQELLDGLEGLDALGSRRGGSARASSLRGAVDASWHLLSAAERDALALLSVFAGPFEAAAGAAVLGRPAVEAAEVLHGLVERSLVLADPRGPETRFRLLAMVKERAREDVDPEALAGARRRHRDLYVERAKRGYDRRGYTGGFASDRQAADEPEHRAAWAEAHAAGDGDAAAWACFALAPALRGTMSAPSAVAQLRATLELPGVLPPWRGRLLLLLAQCLLRSGPAAPGLAPLEEALAIARAEGDRQGEGAVLGALAWQAEMAGDLVEACRRSEEALVPARELGHLPNLFRRLLDLSVLDLEQGRRGSAEGRIEELGRLAARLARPWFEVTLAIVRCRLALADGDPPRAREHLERVFALGAADPDQSLRTSLFLESARAHLAAADPDAATDDAEHALELAAELDHQVDLLDVRITLARAMLARGDAPGAQAALRAALAAARARGVVRHVPEAERALAHALGAA